MSGQDACEEDRRESASFPTRPGSGRRRRVLLALLGVLVVVLYLGRLGGFPLQDPDEGRYAEIPREMIERGDWITPRLDYVDYFEKPPLFYWLVAMDFQTFGTSEGAARLVPALAGLATILVSYLLGRRLFGPRAALVGAAALATAPLFYAFSQALVIDVLATFLITACLAAIWWERCDPRDGRWPIVAACCAALGVLAKGLIGLVLPGLVVLVLLALERDAHLVRALLRPAAIAAFLVIAVPWFAVMAARHPDFAREFFLLEHVERFATSKVGHPQGPFYYLPVLALGLLPWTLLASALSLTGRGRSAWRELPPDGRRFLLVWTFVVVGFFSIATSKLAGYVLPALPPAMLLLGGWIDRLDVRMSRGASAAVRGTAGFLLLVGVVLVVGAVALPHLGHLTGDVVLPSGAALRRVRLAILLSGAIAIAGGAWWARARAATHGAAAAVVGMAVVLALLLLPLAAARSMVNNSRHLAAAIAREARPDDLVVEYRTLLQGLLFYRGARIVQVGDCGEISRGAARAPDRSAYFWNGTDRLERVWRSGRGVFIVTNRRYLDELRAKLFPAAHVVAEDGQELVLANRPATRRARRAAVSAHGTVATAHAALGATHHG